MSLERRLWALRGGFWVFLGRPRERLGVLWGFPREHSESFEELRGGFWSGNDEKVKFVVFPQEFNCF